MNLPNKLTLARIALVPVIVLLYLWIPADFCVLDRVSGFDLRNLLVLILFAAASITDYYDGMLARKNHWITSFGKFADPIADKLLVNTLLILMVWSHTANVVAVLLMTGRDLLVDGLRFVAASRGEVVSAGWWGKCKTVLQMLAVISLLLCNWPLVHIGFPLDQVLLWLACAASLYSGWIYFLKLRHYIFESM